MADDKRESTSEQSSETSQAQETRSGWSNVVAHMSEKKIDTALWATRALTLFFTLSYFIPFFMPSHISYKRVLISNAATSALRLYQRVERVTISREFISQVMTEDSAHYLLYSLTFITCAPITIVLAPIVLFAVLHFASNSLTLFDIAGENNALAPRFLISLVEFQQRNILRGAAFIEIILMPVTVLNVFFGRVSLVSPFVYFQFLSLRYASRRNPYTRSMFYELRVSVEMLANSPSCPSFIRNLIYKCIAAVSRMATNQAAEQ